MVALSPYKGKNLMRALIIDEKSRVDINKLIDFSKIHQYKIDDLKKVMEGLQEPAGNCPDHVIHLPEGFRVVYSIEEQPKGLCHHLSISVDGNLYPSEVAVQEIMKEFGIKTKISQCTSVWIEKEVRAINILDLISK